jgi:hypothetical protein
VMFAAGVLIYLRATRPKVSRNIPHAKVNYGFWSFIIFLAVAFAAALFGPPPPSVHALAFSAIAIWLTVPWAAWGDRQRDPVP